MSKTTQHINTENLIRINESLRGFPKLEPTKQFDEAFNHPIAVWEASKRKAKRELADLFNLWRIRCNQIMN